MNLKTNLTYLSILIGLVLFSNQMGYAQIKIAALFPTDVNRNTNMDVFKLQLENVRQFDTCFGLAAKQAPRKFHSVIINENLGLNETSKNYYASGIIRNAENVNRSSVAYRNYALPGLSYENLYLIQNQGKHVETKEFYLHKAKNQNTTAWIFLGGGTAIAIIGAIGFDANFDIWSSDQGKADRTDIFGFMIIAGIVADLVSIPFFISSHHNKKIASIISLGNQNRYSPPINSYSMNPNPTLTLKVNF
jgi:hypothetical protein